MSRTLNRAVLSLVFLTSVFACTSSTEPKGPAAKALQMASSLTTLNLTDTATLNSVVTDSLQNPISGAVVTYTSSNNTVATVSGNRVIAHAAGDIIITGTVAGTSVTNTVPITVRSRFARLSGRPFGIAYVSGSPGSILVSSLDVNGLTFVNAGTFAVGKLVGVSTTPSDVFVNSAGTVAYVSAVDGPNVSAVNIGSAALQQSIADLGSARVVLSPDGTRLYVGKNGGLDVFTVATSTMTNSFPLGTQVNGVAVSPDGATLWASEKFSGKVFRINTATMKITDSLNVGGAPQDVVYHAASGNIYVANEYGWVDVLSGANLASTGHFNSLLGAFALRLSPDGSKLYVSASTAGQVYVVDRATGTINRTVVVGGVPRRIVFLPDGRAAVANEFAWVDLLQ
ncbi:MAG TPA: YncE family protein [Gemmatimonadaceae bacterium]|nr:YncE family protein [Gemmatimonadaceae bacterium]